MEAYPLNALLELPETIYRSYDSAISQSQLKEILVSPAHFKYRKDKPKTTTQSMKFGTMFHTLLLEPERFDVPLAPEGVKRNQNGSISKRQEGYEEWWEKALHEETYFQLLDMVNAVKAHPEYFLIEKGLVERSIFWEEDGILLKARPDIINTDLGYILDVKTIDTDARQHSFRQANYKYNYAFQAYTYMRAYRAVTGTDCFAFYFMVVESTPPHGVMLYQVINNDYNSDFFKQGQMEFENALRDYKQCLTTNSYPCYPYYQDGVKEPYSI